MPMSKTKEEVINMVKQMPEEVNVVDIMAELYFCQKVNRGLKSLDNGESVSHKQVKQRMKKWLS